MRLHVGVRHVEGGPGAVLLDLLVEVGDRRREGAAPFVGADRPAAALQDDHLERLLDAELAALEIGRDAVMVQRRSADRRGLVPVLLFVGGVRGNRHAPHVIVQAVAVVEIAVADEEDTLGRVGRGRLDRGRVRRCGGCHPECEDQRRKEYRLPTVIPERHVRCLPV